MSPRNMENRRRWEREYYHKHIEQERLKLRLYRKENPEKVRAWDRINHHKHKEHRNLKRKQYYYNHKDISLAKVKLYNKTHKAERKDYDSMYRQNNKTSISLQRKQYRQTHYKEIQLSNHILNKNLKIKVLTYYGNGKLKCISCGFDNIQALSLDHINGGGNAERRLVKLTSGINFYRWLLKHNLPSGYQTLCMNCQFIKRAQNNELLKIKRIPNSSLEVGNNNADLITAPHFWEDL